jgi:hypothetical protein
VSVVEFGDSVYSLGRFSVRVERRCRRKESRKSERVGRTRKAGL